MINNLVDQVFYSVTARKMKFSIKDFFSKCVQIRVQVQCVSGCRHHKWCVMLNLQNLFIVKAFLLFFIKLVCLRELSSGVGIKHPYIEKCQLTCLPNRRAYVRPTSLHFPVVVNGAKDSFSKGCNCGSTQTSLHISLRRDDMKPFFLQDRAW